MVFCKDCEYWPDYPMECINQECNKDIGTKNTPVEEETVYAIPNKHNKNNNCQHYEKAKEPEPIKYPSHCCQKCGEQIGWFGRLFDNHVCDDDRVNW